MGNMSNPIINRWGLNLFWYNHWFTDKKYFLSVNGDHAINRLVYVFLNFGLLFPVNVFIHRYWFKKLKGKDYHNEHNTKYYRIINFKNFITKEISSYNERIRVGHIYQSRIWILKFQHWVLINFYCFNPIKKRQKKLSGSNRKIDIDSYFIKSQKNLYFYKRFKFVLFFFFNKTNSRSNYFFF